MDHACSVAYFFPNLKSEIINIPSIGDDMHISFLVSRVKLLIYQNLLLYQVLVVMIFKKKKSIGDDIFYSVWIMTHRPCYFSCDCQI